MYRLTTGLAAFRPDRTGPLLYPAIAAEPAEVSRFLGALAGTVPAGEYFTPWNILRLVGARLLTGSRLTRRAG